MRCWSSSGTVRWREKRWGLCTGGRAGSYLRPSPSATTPPSACLASGAEERSVGGLAILRRDGAMGKLDGKVVIVTGASRGSGAEIARLFAAEGGRVVC